MSHITRFTIAVTAIGLTVAGCRDAARSLTAPSSDRLAMSGALDESALLVPRVIAPRTTDPDIDFVPVLNPELNHHYVWLDPSQKPRPKLLVFMPGAGGTARPASFLLVQEEAARLGYRVIGLMYQNDAEVVVKCGGSANPVGHSLDPDCSRNMRLEILDGIDHSSVVTVTRANSIENRLAKLLAYLGDQFPDEGWSRFLEDDGTPRWSQIAFSGQSQGSGQAALIGTLHHVDRVVMFSGPPDARVPEEVDPWISIGATPAAKYFALFHDRDHLVVGIRANLTALIGQFGDPVIAELNDPPYGGTHIVYTDLRPTLGYDAPNAPHQSTARDNNTPVDANGTPLLRDAWRYLLGDEPRGGSEKTVTLLTP
ncbi:MAG: hypothetical protein AUH41_01325 [Gemmatimonadetes bacterium 13_1_40CM_66_11]|nr:MAG: hypothetical protein AUH41_01325 [Gemmatimonadetes bacterium 13_1_40CM_66_11]